METIGIDLTETTHGQSIGKQISYKSYRRIARFNGYFYNEGFLDWLLDLEDYLTMRILVMREKLNLLCINLESMAYDGGNEYRLIESDKVKTKFIHGQGWKKCLLSNFILWIVMNFCRI